MTPYSQEMLVNNINNYFPSLNAENCELDLRYHHCEVRCVIDAKSGYVLSLSQKMITDITLQAELDFVLTQSAITLSATMVNHIDFTDFIWN